MHRQQSNSLLNNGSLPPLHPAPGTTAPAPLTPPPSPTDEIRIIQGRSASSRNIFHAGFRYSKDSKPLVDGQQSWRCVKRDDHFPGRIYTINDTFYQMPILHAGRIAEVKHIVSTYHSYEDNVLHYLDLLAMCDQQY